MVVAFHWGHRWSHTNALAHVEEAAGFSSGLYVSYVFSVLWTGDALWWLLAFGHALRRPHWLGMLWHVIVAFIVFNATVIYGHGVPRWLSAVGFAVLAVLGTWRLATRQT
jgi:hypothetical protein